jgi:nanoRNase/pAp phosphatase (c-di-AMP/oligoRNAs hydrolase)
MSQINKAVDIYILYRIIKDLSTPFNETDAFKLGLIDDTGKRLKKSSTKEEKDSLSYYNRFIFNLKRILRKFGLGSRVATFAAALFLLKEQSEKRYSLTEDTFKNEDAALADIVATIKYLENNSLKKFRQFEEEIANVTGDTVVGTGDSEAHWKKMPYRVGPKGELKRKGRYINGVAYLKKVAKEANKRTED